MKRLMHLWLSLLCLATLMQPASSTSIWERRKKLLDQDTGSAKGGGYDADLPPPNMGDGTTPLKVQVGMSIKQLNYDIVSGMLHLRVWIREKWLDDRLLYNGTEWFGPAGFDARSSYVPVDLMDQMDEYVWTPDLHCKEAPDFFKGQTEAPASMYSMQSPGVLENPPWNMYLVRPAEFTAYCKPKLTEFPWDHQSCPLTFESWSFSSRYMNVVPMLGGHEELMTFPSSNEYKLIDTPKFLQEECVQYEGSSAEFCPVVMTVELRRLPMYYMLNAIVPMFMMVILSTLTFWIPLNPDYAGSGERLAYGITSLLTIVAVVLFTAEKRPMIHEATWLDQFQAISIILCVIPIVETCLVFWLEGILQDAGTIESISQFEAKTFSSSDEGDPEALDYVKEVQEIDTFGSQRAMEQLICFKRAVGGIGILRCCFGTGVLAPRSIDVLFRHIYPIVVSSRMIFFFYSVPTDVYQDFNFLALWNNYYPIWLITFLLLVGGVFNAILYICRRFQDADEHEIFYQDAANWRYSRSRLANAMHTGLSPLRFMGHGGYDARPQRPLHPDGSVLR